jgi:inorganic triphosphatase YgiF
MGREFELKYAATEASQSAIRDSYGPWQEIRMETTYFDTADRALSSRHMTLRLRRENDETICTLKTPLPDGSRGEWECHEADIGDGIRALIVMGAPKILEGITINGVLPSCGARFIRLATQIPTADGMAELALDSGVLLGGGKESPLCEVEIELKSGSEASAVALAQHLATQYGLKEEPRSKFRRAMELAQGE